MARFAIRRILQGLLTLFLMITGIFFFVQIIMPGDFVSNFILGLTLEQATEWRTQLGLDQPLWQQYLKWLRNLFTRKMEQDDRMKFFVVFKYIRYMISSSRHVLPLYAF